VRSIWNGNISFGLVSIPIKMYPATEEHSVSFRQVHTVDGGRIRYRKFCELEERQVDTQEIGRAYEDAEGALVPITDEDLAQLPLPTTRTLEIEAFVSASQIDPLQMGSAYYLGANGSAAAKPYTLLREALKRSEKVAIAKYALHGRERLGMLRVVGEAIALHRLLWPDEVREAAGMAPQEKVSVRDAELDLADTLMATLGEVDLDSLRDEYYEALESLVEAKVSGAAPLAEPGERPLAGGQVVDLMSALQDSVRTARQARGEESAEGGGAGDGTDEEAAGDASVTPIRGRKAADRKGAGAEKTAPKKTAPKQAAAGKSGPKKSAPKKSSPKTGSEQAASGTAKSGTGGGRKTAEPAKKGSGARKGGAQAAGKSGQTKTAAQKQTARRGSRSAS
jgi:DNA end-binding protein Ku